MPVDRYSRRALLLRLGAIGLGVVGCEEASRGAQRPPASASGSAAPASPSALLEAASLPVDPTLAASRVGDDNFAQSVLYTWTTADQIQQLRKSKRLLVHRTSKQGNLSRFDTELAAQAHPLAKRLRTAPLKLRRFAWVHPWATLQGVNDERYGKQLVRVRLKPSAIVARFDPSAAEPWSARDLAGKAVSVSTLVSDASRLAAVYHQSPAAPEGGQGAFREYVLCNESQIAEWSYGTQEIRDKLSEDAAMLARLENLEEVNRLPYEAALAFPTDFYGYSQEKLARIQSELRSLGFGPVLRVAPTVAFADQGTPPAVVRPRPASRPVKKPWKRKQCAGTWC